MSTIETITIGDSMLLRAVRFGLTDLKKAVQEVDRLSELLATENSLRLTFARTGAGFEGRNHAELDLSGDELVIDIFSKTTSARSRTRIKLAKFPALALPVIYSSFKIHKLDPRQMEEPAAANALVEGPFRYLMKAIVAVLPSLVQPPDDDIDPPGPDDPNPSPVKPRPLPPGLRADAKLRVPLERAREPEPA